jgi:hypothetical protein
LETAPDSACLDHNVDLSFHDDGAGIGGFDDGMDWAETQVDGNESRDAGDEEDTEERTREKDKLAGVCYIQAD